MAEKDIISDPEGSLENFPSGDIYNLSGRGDEETPPKNPSGTEAGLIILGLGVVPDVFDFFSIGGLSFLSSALSWPVTEYYFYQKNLKVPNIRKWIRGFNLGDIIPFLGVLPMKTIGLLAGIYIAWHPESKIAKGAQALEVASSIKEATKKPPAGGGETAKKGSTWEKIKQLPKNWKGRAKRELMSMEEFAYAKDKSSQKDIYEEIREGAGGIMGPEEQAERETFGEVISFPEEQAAKEELATAETPQTKTTRTPEKPKPISEIAPAAQSVEKMEKTEEIESRLGIGEVEREIKEILTSPEAVMEDQGVPTFNDGRGVDLRGRGGK